MHRFIFLFFITLLGFVSSAQDRNYVDSLKRDLYNSKEDTAKVKSLSELAYEYVYYSPDTCLRYAREGLVLARKINYKQGEVLCIVNIALAYHMLGNNPQALQLLLQALQEAEKIGFTRGVITSLGNIGEIYSVLGDQGRAIIYSKKSMGEAQKHNLRYYEMISYTNLGEYFEKLGQPDSALYYENVAYQLNRELKVIGFEQAILYNLGKIHMALLNEDLAASYYKKSLALFPNTGDKSYASKALFGLGAIFERTNQLDSGLHYYKLSVHMAQEGKNLSQMLSTTKYLANVYDRLNKDSLLKYLKLSTSYRDSLLTEQNIHQIQNLTFSEQQRQQESEMKKSQEANARKLNIEYFSIGVGIILFITLFLFLSRSIIVSEKWLSFIGALGLLIVFEFINLFIHPTLSSITHESTLLTLLIMVVIASILIPVHHQLEHWVKVRVVEKNRLIRLKNAEKTIRDLREKMGETKDDRGKSV